MHVGHATRRGLSKQRRPDQARHDGQSGKERPHGGGCSRELLSIKVVVTTKDSEKFK